jgi:hypothetical protein
MKLRSFFTILVAVVASLLLFGASGFYWLTSHNPLSVARIAQQLEPDAAMFVPRQAPLMASLMVDLEQLEEFRVAAVAPGRRQQARAELEQLESALLANTGLNYKSDIQPWLGDEITFAVTTSDIDRNAENGAQPGYLLIVSTVHPERSREFLQLFWQKRAVAGKNLVFEQYSGVKLIYATSLSSQPLESSQLDSDIGPSLTPTLASAVVGDRFILFANHPKVLRDAITNVQVPGLNLVSSDVYQDTLRDLPHSGIGLTIINLPELADWLGTANTIPAASVTDVDWTYHSLVMALKLNREGIVGETALLTAPGKSLTPRKPSRSGLSDALRFIPDTSPLVALSINLKQLWSNLLTEFSDDNPLMRWTEQLQAALQARWGLDLPHDVIEWVTGEYELALMPHSDSTILDWLFVAETSPDAVAGIEQLDAIAKQQGLSVGPIELDNQRVSAWTKLSTAASKTSKAKSQSGLALSVDVQGVHTTVGNYELFATSVDAMNQALNTSDDQSVFASSDFRRAIAPFNSANDGYLYLDWPALRDTAAQYLPLTGVIESFGKPFFNHWRSLTLTSYGSTSTMRRGAVFIRLKD